MDIKDIEEKKGEITPPEASQDQNKTEDQKKDSQASAKTEENQVDYKTAYEQEVKRREQADFTIQKLKKDQRRDALEFGDDDDKKEDDDTRVGKIEDKRPSPVSADSAGLAALVATMSSDPDERKLILFHYSNSIQHTGVSADAILNDLENARVLANKFVFKENEELKRTLRTKQTMTNTSIGNNQDRSTDVETSELKLTPQEAALLARRQLSAKDVKRIK